MKKTLLLLGLLGGFAISATPINQNNLTSIKDNVSVKNLATNTIKNGYVLDINFRDDYGNLFKLKDLKVDVLRVDGSTNTVVHSGYTNSEGRFEFVNLDEKYGFKDAQAMYFMRIYTKSRAFQVVDEQGQLYYYETEPYLFFHYATYQDFQTFNMYEHLGRKFALTQTVRLAAEYGKFLNNNKYVGFVNVVYPTSKSACHYSELDQTIYLSEEINSAELLSSRPNIYSDFDTVCHEYGHHVQRILEISKSPGGTHYQGWNCEDFFYDRLNAQNSYMDKVEAREYGLHLAYGEGWATAFSMLAQRHFKDEFAGRPFYADTAFTLYSGLHDNAESYMYPLGEGSEDAIWPLIFNIFDEYHENDPDDLLCEDESLFMTCSKGSYTISDWLNKYRSRCSNLSSLSKLFGKLGFSPSFVRAPKVMFKDVAPTFTFECSGGSIYYPNNEFIVSVSAENGFNSVDYEFYVESKNADETATFTIPLYNWEQLISTGAQTFTVSIEAWCNWYETFTGVYTSPEFTFDMPTKNKPGDDYAYMIPGDWHFPQQYNNQEIVADIVENGHVLHTRRLRTGCIEKNQIVLSAKKKGAGLAYFEIMTDEPMTEFYFDYSLWSSSEGINANNASIVVEFYDVDHIWFAGWQNMLTETTISTDRNNMDTDHSIFGCEMYGVRWTITAPATGSHNNGRFCIGNMMFVF